MAGTLLTGLASSPLALTSEGNRLKAPITVPGAKPGQPVVASDGNLAGVLEMVHLQPSASSLRGTFVGTDDLRHFRSRFWFRATVAPPVLDPQTHLVRVHIYPLLEQLTGLEGSVQMTVSGHDPVVAPLNVESRLGNAQLVIPESWWRNPPSRCDLKVTLSDRAGHTVALRRYRLRVAGWSQGKPPNPLQTSSGLHTRVVSEQIDPGPSKPALGRLSRGLQTSSETGHSKVIITDNTVRQVGEHRLIGKNYEKLPIGTTRGLAQQYDVLRDELPRIENRLAMVQREARNVEEYYEYIDIAQRYNDILNERERVRTQLRSLRTKIQHLGICRCPDGVWHLKRAAPCNNACSVP